MCVNVKCTKETSVTHVKRKITKANHTLNAYLALREYLLEPLKWYQLLYSNLFNLMLRPTNVNADTKWKNTVCRRNGYATQKVVKSTKARTATPAKTKATGMMGILFALLVQKRRRVFQNKLLRPKSITVNKDTKWNCSRKRRTMDATWKIAL